MEQQANEIQNILNKILSPHTTQQERALCTQKCEAYKNDSNVDNQFNIASYIIKNSSKFDLNTFKFAIQLFHHYLINNWNLLPVPQRNHVKATLINFLLFDKNGDSSSRNFIIIDQPKYILDAFAKCLTALALRTWPQAWDSMLVDFNNITSISPEHCQIVLLTLTRLEEDVISIQPDTIGIIKKRRQDLAKAVALQNGDILEFVSEKLCNVLKILNDGSTAHRDVYPYGPATNSQATKSYTNLLTTGLQAYEAYASWAKPALIYEGQFRNKFMEILFDFLNHSNPELAILAVRTIISVTGSKVTEIEKCKHLIFLHGGSLRIELGFFLKDLKDGEYYSMLLQVGIV